VADRILGSAEPGTARPGSPPGPAQWPPSTGPHGGISRPSRHLTTQAGEISPEGKIARPRVQAVVEPRKMRGDLCPRPDTHLNYMIDIALTAEFSLAAGDAR
jgi:hypothetical protein